MSIFNESIVGLSLILVSLTWNVTHRHQPATHLTDTMVVLGVLGTLINVHAMYRRAVKQYRYTDAA